MVVQITRGEFDWGLTLFIYKIRRRKDVQNNSRQAESRDMNYDWFLHNNLSTNNDDVNNLASRNIQVSFRNFPSSVIIR